MRAWRAFSTRSVFSTGKLHASKSFGGLKAQLSHDARVRFVESPESRDDRPYPENDQLQSQDGGSQRTFRNDDEFYEYFLRLPKPRILHKFTHYTPPWPGLIAEDKLASFLPTNLSEKPQRVFENRQADVVEVLRALKLFIARGRNLERDQDAKRYADANIGVLALHWLLHSGAVDEIDLFAEQRLLRNLIYCIAAQGQARFVRDWLYIPHTPKYARSWALDDQRVWKASALRHLVEATTQWQGLEDSLQFFLDTSKFNCSLEKNSLRFTPLKASAVHLYKYQFVLQRNRSRGRYIEHSLAPSAGGSDRA